jgi:hypothetical protein
VGPVGGGGAEAFADGVVEDVGPFFFEAFVVAEAVLEEVALPAETGLLGGVAFPGGEAFGDFGFVGEADEEVEVVRHDEGEVDVPEGAVVVVAEGGEEDFGDAGAGEGSGGAIGGAEGEEEDGAGLDPWRDVVGEGAALGERGGFGGMFHVEQVFGVGWEGSDLGTRRGVVCWG